MEEAIWSATFARRVAGTLGYELPGAASTPDGVPFVPEAAQLVQEVTEAFRYLPPDKIGQVEDLAEFLAARGPGQRRGEWALGQLQAVRDYANFLRGLYGSELPADERDYWTDEDREDCQRAAWERLDAEDPYPWEDAGDAHPG